MKKLMAFLSFLAFSSVWATINLDFEVTYNDYKETFNLALENEGEEFSIKNGDYSILKVKILEVNNDGILVESEMYGLHEDESEDTFSSVFLGQLQVYWNTPLVVSLTNGNDDFSLSVIVNQDI